MGKIRTRIATPREAGFSLIELLTVVAIIAILAAVAAPNILGYLRNYKIRGAAQQVAGEIQQARAKAIMGNVNRGITFAVVDGDSYRWIQEDAIDVQPTPANPYTGTVYTLPLGIRFDTVAGGSASIRFNRLGAMCLPGATGCGAAFAPFCAVSETACTDAVVSPPTFFDTTNPQMITVRLRETSTGLTRTIQIAPGGRVLVQP